MQVLIIIVWILISLLIYFVMMGITRVLALKVWGEPLSYVSEELNWDQLAFWAAQVFWQITLPILLIKGIWWVGYHSPELTVRLFKWIDKAFDEEAERAKLRATQNQEQQSLTTKPQTRRGRRKRTPRSGTELEIYKGKDEEHNHS